MSGWTPGPWAATKPNANGEVFIKDTRVPPQLITSAVQSDSEHAATANANLIAAAPDLAMALDAAAQAIDKAGAELGRRIGHEDRLLDVLALAHRLATEVLAKARGEA